jgi:hypothetical protein
MRTEEVRESFRLGLAQLGELSRHVGYRAVVLAQLLAHADVTCRRSVALPGQRGRKGLGPVSGCGLGHDRCTVPVHERVDTALREGAHSLFPARLGEEPDRGDREVVVGVAEPGASGISEQEELRGTATTALGLAGCVPRYRLAVREQCVDVTAHSRGADAQFLGDSRRGDRTLLQQEPGDGAPSLAVVLLHGVKVGLGVFHNTSVAYLAGGRKDRGHRVT